MKRQFCFVVILFLIILCIQFAWLSLNQGPIDIEGMDYVFFTMKAYKQLFEGDFMLGQFLSVSGARAPLPVYLSSIILSIKNLGAVIFVSSFIYLFILTASIYSISKEIFNERVALVATILLLLSNGISFIYHTFFPDLCLAAYIALTLSILLKTKHFSNKKYSILAGVIAGVGWLAKWQFILYIIPMIVYFLFQNKELFFNKKILLKYLVITLIICPIIGISFFAQRFLISPFFLLLIFIVCYIVWRIFLLNDATENNILDFFVAQFFVMSFWYLYHNKHIINAILYFTKSSHSELFRVGPLLSWVNLSYYLKKIIFEHLSVFIVGAVILAGLFLFIRKLVKRDYRMRASAYASVLFVSFLFVYLVFTIIENKDPRHIFPAIIFLYPLLARLLSLAFRKRVLVTIVTLLVVISLINILSLSFEMPSSKLFYNINFKFEKPHWWIEFQPQPAEYDVCSILSYINTSKHNLICLLEYYEGLTSSYFKWQEFVYGLRPQRYNEFNLVEWDVYPLLKRCDYLITKPINPGWPQGTVKLRQFYEALRDNKSLRKDFEARFGLITIILNKLNKNDYVEIFKKIE